MNESMSKSPLEGTNCYFSFHSVFHSLPPKVLKNGKKTSIWAREIYLSSDSTLFSSGPLGKSWVTNMNLLIS